MCEDQQPIIVISQEGYYGECIKGKTAAQIMTVICGLKNKIGHLESTPEHPNDREYPIIHLSDSIRLRCGKAN